MLDKPTKDMEPAPGRRQRRRDRAAQSEEAA